MLERLIHELGKRGNHSSRVGSGSGSGSGEGATTPRVIELDLILIWFDSCGSYRPCDWWQNYLAIERRTRTKRTYRASLFHLEPRAFERAENRSPREWITSVFEINLSVEKKKLFLVFSLVIRRPYWCTQQRQNVAQVLHKNRIKFFFHCCSLQQHGHCDVMWKPRIYVCIMNSPRQFQMSYFSPVVLLLFFDVRFTLGGPLNTFCNCKRLWKNRLLLCCYLFRGLCEARRFTFYLLKVLSMAVHRNCFTTEDS